MVSELCDAVFGDQKFLTAVAAGTGPDASIQNRHTFMQFAAKNVYQDVTPYMEVSGMAKDDFTPVQLEESSWNGKVYGLPLFTDTRIMWWNKKHFEEVGLDPEVPPVTWEELGLFAEKLNVDDGSGGLDRIGFVPYLFGNSWMWLYGFLNRAPAISDDKRTIMCDDERWIYALDWMVDFYDKYVGSFELANAFSESVGASGLGDVFIAGKTSIYASGDWTVGQLQRVPDFDWGYAPMPIPPEGEKSTWSCGWSVSMVPSSENPDEAWELMRWLADDEGWHARAEATKNDMVRTWEREQIEGEAKFWPQQACYLPALQMLEDEYISLLDEREQGAWALCLDALQNWTHGCGTEMGVAALEYWVEMDNAVRTALSGNMTASEAMLDCKAKVQAGTDRAWEAIDSAS